MSALATVLVVLIVAILIATAPRRTPRWRLPPYIRDAESPIPPARRLADWRWTYSQLPPEAR